ncbi:MAG: Ig-like domain-containing protein [Lachnospira sp.]|nr:Ig-like domain-containing protein [Lachnospira sp.]
MKILKKVVCYLLVLTMIFTGFFIEPTAAKTTYTKAKLTKMIKTNKKKLASAQKKLKAEKKKYKKQVKGTKVIYFGNVLSRDPYIIKDGITGSYYWITNSKSMSTLLTLGMGFIKTTGKYKKYNGFTCAVAKAVKVTANPTKYEEKVKAIKAKINTYQLAKKAHAVFAENSKITVGDTYTVAWYWNDYTTDNSGVGKFNKMKFVSSNPEVLEIVDSKKCVVKALKEGTSTIIATASCSGKKSQYTVVVQAKEEPYTHITNMSFSKSSGGSGLLLNIDCADDSSIKPLKEGEPKVYIEDESIFSIESFSLYGNSPFGQKHRFYNFTLELKQEGTTVIHAESQEGVSASATIHVYKEEGTEYWRFDIN